LSGGEQQRVALARALVRQPNLFLLDEPLSNLDAKLRHSARHEIKRLHERMGVTTIYVTHDQVEAMGLGQRVAVMNFGRIEQIGTPSDIYREPVNTFVARFMGSPSMNLIRRNGRIVGFRPENFLPAGHYPSAEQAQHFSFPVASIEDLGADILLYGSVGSEGSGEVIAKLPASLAGAIASGKQHDFFVRRNLIKFFDAESGRRLKAEAA
jgi:multiple sugar transport system ATP-binding protein